MRTLNIALRVRPIELAWENAGGRLDDRGGGAKMEEFMRFRVLLFTALALILGSASAACAVDAPKGPALLIISGNIANTNRDGQLVLDQKAFEALPFATVSTETPWTDGMVTFEGVSLQTLLDLAGAKGDTIHAVALNDYAVDIPSTDAANLKVIVAYRMNGETMRVRDKGPLWLIYPLSEEPSLDTEATHSKMIWQIKEFSIQ